MFEIVDIEGRSAGWKEAAAWGPAVDTTPTAHINSVSDRLQKP